MRHINLIVVLIMSVFIYSCNRNPNTEAHEAEENSSSKIDGQAAQLEAAVLLKKDPRKIGPEKPESQRKIDDNIYKINAAENPLYGYWVGAFGKNKINIALAHAENDSVFGHSVCAGNFRPIKGTVKQEDPGVYKMVMQEPGDDKYDGTFVFSVDVDKKELSGSWQPYQNTVGAKTFTLKKRIFKYDPHIGDFPQASTRYLEVPDVENLLPEEIEMIRNEIYARHGYSFTNLKIRRVFDAQSWYIPMGVDIREQLTDLEAHNIDLLYNYETYYEEYYNDFGR